VALVADDEVFERRVRAILTDRGIETIVVRAPIDDRLEDVNADVIVHADTFGVNGIAKNAHSVGAPVLQITPQITARHIRQALAAGVAAVVRESDLETCLVHAVHAVCSGQLVLPGEAATLMATPSLSTREKQVIGLVVLGFSNADIARKLHLAETTIKSHLTSSFRKLGVRTRNEATMRILDRHTGLGLGILAVTDAGMDAQAAT
jgi:DNA-binding NarL/FixJ family response regulator